MKINEIRNLDSKGLDERLSELKKELIKVNAQVAIGTTPKNPGQVKAIKKTIARIMGVKNEKPLGGNKIKAAEEIKKIPKSAEKKIGGSGKSEISGPPHKKSEVVKKHE